MIWAGLHHKFEEEWQMQPGFGVDDWLYMAARDGWVDESHYPHPTSQCPNPYASRVLTGSQNDGLQMVARIVKETKGTKTWRELIGTVMENLQYNGQGVRDLALRHSLDGEVVQAMTALWLLSMAREKGLFGWEDIKPDPPPH